MFDVIVLHRDTLISEDEDVLYLMRKMLRSTRVSLSIVNKMLKKNVYHHPLSTEKLISSVWLIHLFPETSLLQYHSVECHISMYLMIFRKKIINQNLIGDSYYWKNLNRSHFSLESS